MSGYVYQTPTIKCEGCGNPVTLHTDTISSNRDERYSLHVQIYKCACGAETEIKVKKPYPENWEQINPDLIDTPRWRTQINFVPANLMRRLMCPVPNAPESPPTGHYDDNGNEIERYGGEA